jgi:hypothetical protein
MLEQQEEDKPADQKSGISRLILLKECGFYLGIWLSGLISRNLLLIEKNKWARVEKIKT